MYRSSYHNTNELSGNDLLKANADCASQEAKILKVFEENPRGLLTPEEVQNLAGLMNAPLTSIRRAITNLTEAKHLIKSSQMKDGKYGKPVHCWRLSIEEGQTSLEL